MRITIITPSTHSRYAWIQLQDAFYNDQAVKVGHVYAIDDSRNAFDAMRQELWRIDTPYVTFAGDDDFHFTDRLDVMADWLDYHPAHVGAYGDGILCQLENWKFGWTADYAEAMRIERAFSLMRTSVFKAAFEHVRESPLLGREIMNTQNLDFRCAVEQAGPFQYLQGMQFIRCHHVGRGQLETTEALFKRLAEKYGGGWLASWLPSRAHSRRNLERPWAPHYREFQQFKRVVKRFAREYQHQPEEELSIDE